MAVLDPSSCVFYHFTRKFEDSERQYTWDNWIKIGLLRSNLCRLVGMNFYARKRHTLMVSFVAARLGSSVGSKGQMRRLVKIVY